MTEQNDKTSGRVAGKVALVTGGASGLGAASAMLMAENGASVAITDMNLDGAQQVADDINKTCGDGRAIALTLNVTSEEQWIAAVDKTVEAFGYLDILLNSAGVGNMNDIETETLEGFQFVNAVNLDGTFLGCKHGIAAMKKTSQERGGSIINISSVSGLIGGHNMAAYNASKGGVRLLSKSVALHCARKGYNIRCNSVHPTFIDTPMVQAMYQNAPEPDVVKSKLIRQVPIGRLGVADDVAQGILYLASNESSFMTGSEFVLDGGITAQ
jgi:3(or 17)beta-hydroxysteroid dehydrogenase